METIKDRNGISEDRELGFQIENWDFRFDSVALHAHKFVT